MEEREGSARGVSLRAAACMLAGDTRDPVAGARVRRAVDAQLRRAGVEAQNAGDVRTEVVLALLCAPAAELPFPLELVCARAAAIARNKAIDQRRRAARAPITLGEALPEPAQPGALAGSLADGLDEVTAQAHRRRVRAELVLALGRLEPAQRAAISAHAEGGAAPAAGLPRSTYYRALTRAQARLSSDLRGRLAGLAALGAVVRRGREVLAHVETAHAAAAAATAAVAVSAAVALSVHDQRAHPLPLRTPPAPAQAAGGRVSPPPAAAPAVTAARTAGRRAPATNPASTAAVSRPAPAVPAPSPAPCVYDPSTYDC